MKKAEKARSKRIDIFVIRINKQEKLRNARPCHNCLQMMKDVGIRRVYYSVTNDIVCEKVSDMVSIESSTVTMMVEKSYYSYPITSYEYYVDLLKKKFPAVIKKGNLDLFLKYNLSNVMPNCSWSITKVKGSSIIVIVGNDSDILIKANII